MNTWQSFLSVGHIASEFYCVDQGTSPKETYDYLKGNGYSVAGIQSKSGVTVGYVAQDDLKNAKSIEPHLKKFDIEEILPADTPLQAVFHALATERERFYILNRRKVDKILTRSDLRKQSVKALLFSMICGFEEWLAERLRTEKLVLGELLQPKRLADAQEFHTERKRKGQELDLIDCLQLCDKFDALFKHNKLYDFGSKKESTAVKKKLIKLRDNLAHAHDPDNGLPWREISNVMHDIERIKRGSSSLNESTINSG